MSSASSTSRAFPATTLGKLWGRDDYSHDMQDYYTRVYSRNAAAGDLHGRPFGRQTQALLPRPGATTTRAQPQKTLKLRGFLQVLKQPFSMRNTCLKTGFETWRPAPYSASPYLGSTTSEPGVFEQGLEVRTLHIW
jgi:hypothetical protein